MRDEQAIETAVREKDPLLETVVGGHLLEALIGEGSAARVYRARSVDTGQLSAIKVLSREVGADHALVERMRREAEALGRIEHPNVVRTYEFGNTPEGRPYLVMELIRGRTLASIIAEDAPLPRRVFAELARQMAAGLAAAHASGIVHRDLKPSNVLVTNSGTSMPRVKLVDFGLVRGLGSGLGTTDRSLTDHHALLGTPLYMAPEQLMSPREARPTSDLYALGVIFYEMLSGRVPFDGPIMSVFEQHFRAAPPPLTTRTGFEALVFSLLQKSPMDRPPSADSVVDALDVLAEPTGEITRVAANDEEPTGRVAAARELMSDEETTGAAEQRMPSLLPISASFEGPTEGSFQTNDPTIVDRETDASMQATRVGVHRDELKGTRILVEEDFISGGDTELELGGDRDARTVVEDDPRLSEAELPTHLGPAPSTTPSLQGVLVQPVLDDELDAPRFKTPDPVRTRAPDSDSAVDVHDTLVPGQVSAPPPAQREPYESALLAPRPVMIKKPPTPMGVRIVAQPPQLTYRVRSPKIRVTHAPSRSLRVVTGLAILCALFLVAFAITMRIRATGHDLRDIIIPAVGSSTTG